MRYSNWRVVLVEIPQQNGEEVHPPAEELARSLPIVLKDSTTMRSLYLPINSLKISNRTPCSRSVHLMQDKGLQPQHTAPLHNTLYIPLIQIDNSRCLPDRRKCNCESFVQFAHHFSTRMLGSITAHGSTLIDLWVAIVRGVSVRCQKVVCGLFSVWGWF
jgi:hypothetical protein